MIDFEQAYETIPGNGWLSKVEAEFLWNIAKREQGPILEVGCYQGRSTCLLAQLERPIYAVDPFEDFDANDPTGAITRDLFERNLKERSIENVTLFPVSIAAWNYRPVGFAYLDGDHTFEGTCDQILVATRCGAFSVCIHDYAETGGGLEIKRAIDEMNLQIVQVVERMAYCRI